MEIRVEIDTEFFEGIKKKTNTTKNFEVVKDALSIWNWAINEAQNGRGVFSANQDGGEIKQLSMPGLDNIKKTN